LRSELDHAVSAKCFKDEAMRRHPSANRYGCFGGHPRERQPFEPERPVRIGEPF